MTIARTVSLATAACAAAVVAIAMAQTAKPYGSGDATAGRLLAAKDCDACHARLFDGDPNRIYARPDHKVKAPAQLLAQVTFCATRLSLQYFPEDEADLAAYLDRDHYKFGAPR